MKSRRKTGFSQGFTIVELMIALSVLATILLVATVVLVQIGALYAKGINSANLQNAGRNVVTDVSSALQFSGNTPSPCTDHTVACDANTITKSFSGTNLTIGAFCIGSIRYSYVMNSEQGTDSIKNPITNLPAGINVPHALWRDTIKQSAACQPLDLSGNNVLADGSSADTLGGGLSGGYDMLSNRMRLTRFKIEPTAANGDIYSIDVWTAYGDSDLVQTQRSGSSTCSSGAGTQFCAISQISSTVAGRIY